MDTAELNRGPKDQRLLTLTFSRFDGFSWESVVEVGLGVWMHAQNIQGPDPGEERDVLGSAREERPRKGTCARPQ